MQNWRGVERPNLWLADAMLLVVAIIWGSSYAVAKQALWFYPVLGFLAIRFGLTFILLLPQLRGDGQRAVRPGLPLGLVMLGIFLCETWGVMLTSASNAAFLISLCVVFTPFVEWAMLRQRPSNRLFAACALSLVGVWLLTGGTSLSLNLGDGLMSLLMGSEPLFGAIIAGLWLGERLELMGWVGGLLIMVAALGTLRFGRSAAPVAVESGLPARNGWRLQPVEEGRGAVNGETVG